MATYIVTGTAGFIGYHTAERLLAAGHTVVGIDIVNDYYDVQLKERRLERLASDRRGRPEDDLDDERSDRRERSRGGRSQAAPRGQPAERQSDRFVNHRVDLADREGIAQIFAEANAEYVVHLAAQAGVRHSLTDPHTYIDSNVTGFLNILEGCRHNPVKHLVYASSSSVYGLNTDMPFTEHRPADHPVSLYGATKRANELMAHSYSHLFGVATTGLRFFTVYGPWGRPDMALFLFAKAILANEPIRVFNHGEMQRDFTYVDDIVEGILRLAVKPPTGHAGFDGGHPDPGLSSAPWRIYNIGNNAPVRLMSFIEAIERALGREAIKSFEPIQPGDVPATWASTDDLANDVDYQPKTPIEVGVKRFVDWYLDYYGDPR